MPFDDDGQRVDDAERTFDVGTLAGRGRTRPHVGGQASLGLGQLLFEQLLAFVQAGVAHLEFGPTRGAVPLPVGRARRAAHHGRGPHRTSACSSDSRPGSSAVNSSIRRCSRSIDARRSSSAATRPSCSVRSSRTSRCALREALRRGTEPGVVGVERTHQVGLGRAGRRECALRFVEGRRRPSQVGGGNLCRPHRIVERGRRGPGARRTDPPSAQAEPVAGGGHHDGLGMGQRGVDSGRDLVDAHGVPEQPVEQLGHPGPRRVGVRAHRPTDVDSSAATPGARRARSPHRSSTRCAARRGRGDRPPGSSTTTAVSDSPRAASTAGAQPSSISMRSSNVPSTPSTPARRSAPARARAASSASCNASTRAAVLEAASAASARSDRRASALAIASASCGLGRPRPARRASPRPRPTTRTRRGSGRPPRRALRSARAATPIVLRGGAPRRRCGRMPRAPSAIRRAPRRRRSPPDCSSGRWARPPPVPSTRSVGEPGFVVERALPLPGSIASSSAATATSSSWNRAASASRLATRSASSSWTRSRSSERRRSASTAARPRARSRSCSTRTSRSPLSLSPRADSSASIAITAGVELRQRRLEFALARRAVDPRGGERFELRPATRRSRGRRRTS